MRCTNLTLVTGIAVSLMTSVGSVAEAADTVVSFSVTTGELSISAQSAVNLGSGPVGGTVSGSLGEVTVVDARSPSTGDWIARVSSSSYTNGTTTISSSNAAYNAGSGTLVSGTGTLTPGAPGDLGSQRIAMIYSGGGTATSQAFWVPSLSVFVPLGSTLGDYTGTVTHSLT